MCRSALPEGRESLSEEREGYRASIEQELEALADPAGGTTSQTTRAKSWLAYKEAESLALESITQATMTTQADGDES
jgi:hypothetical protein